MRPLIRERTALLADAIRIGFSGTGGEGTPSIAANCEPGHLFIWKKDTEEDAI
jgi:hypothetical protein